MDRVVFVGSHLGYPMDRTPLGGGAMVGRQLAREWARSRDCRLTVLGSGPTPPAEGIDYRSLPPGSAKRDLVRLSELNYARFCREFEAAATRFITGAKPELDPRDTVIVVNDISESPDLAALAARGYPVVSIWHVDVVDFFNRLYLGGIFAPERLSWLFARLEDRGLAPLVPDMLRLVFQKQRAAVARSRRIVVPSRQMAETIRRCFPAESIGEKRILVLPWGGWREEIPEEELARESARLRAKYRLAGDSRVLMTLSRLSPEKGIHYLLEALARLEAGGWFQGNELALFVCGEPAFMRGEAYGRKLRAAAGRLRRFRVFFPGYLAGPAKLAHLRLAELFISPSVHESYGLTIVEAMSAGLPVLASDHYGVDELLRPEYGRTVAYAEPGRRSERLAEAIAALAADPAALRSMGAAARKAAEAMSFERTAKRLLDEALGLLRDAR